MTPQLALAPIWTLMATALLRREANPTGVRLAIKGNPDMSRIIAKCLLLGVFTISTLGLSRPASLESTAGSSSASPYSTSPSGLRSSASAFAAIGDERNTQLAPEAGSMALFGFTLLGIGTVLRRRFRKS